MIAMSVVGAASCVGSLSRVIVVSVSVARVSQPDAVHARISLSKPTHSVMSFTVRVHVSNPLFDAHVAEHEFAVRRHSEN